MATITACTASTSVVPKWQIQKRGCITAFTHSCQIQSGRYPTSYCITSNMVAILSITYFSPEIDLPVIRNMETPGLTCTERFRGMLHVVSDCFILSIRNLQIFNKFLMLFFAKNIKMNGHPRPGASRVSGI